MLAFLQNNRSTCISTVYFSQIAHHHVWKTHLSCWQYFKPTSQGTFPLNLMHYVILSFPLVKNPLGTSQKGDVFLVYGPMSRQHRVGWFAVQLRVHVYEVIIIFKVLCVNVLFVGTSYMWCLPKIDHYESIIVGQAQLHQSLINTEILMKRITRLVSCYGVTDQLYMIYR